MSRRYRKSDLFFDGVNFALSLVSLAYTVHRRALERARRNNDTQLGGHW